MTQNFSIIHIKVSFLGHFNVIFVSFSCNFSCHFHYKCIGIFNDKKILRTILFEGISFFDENVDLE